MLWQNRLSYFCKVVSVFSYSVCMAAVPKVFHFVFGLKKQVQPFSLMHYLALRSCLEVNRPQSLHMHYRHMPWGPLWEHIQTYLELRRLPQAIPRGGTTMGTVPHRKLSVTRTARTF